MATTDDIHREIQLAFWKIHILHHAGERPIYGQWMLEELREHGFRLSPGALYPLLRRMQRHGWLRSRATGVGPKARRNYTLTKKGTAMLEQLRREVAALHREVVVEPAQGEP